MILKRFSIKFVLGKNQKVISINKKKLSPQLSSKTHLIRLMFIMLELLLRNFKNYNMRLILQMMNSILSSILPSIKTTLTISSF